MKFEKTDTALIISLKSDILTENILGSSGWILPEEREEADWIVLIRFMGWQAELISPSMYHEEIIQRKNIKWIILTGPTEEYEIIFMQKMASITRTSPILLICQAPAFADLPDVFTCYNTGVSHEGIKLEWKGSGIKKTWELSKPFQSLQLQFSPNHLVVCELDGLPVIVSTNLGKGKMVTIGFHPSTARDHDGSFTAVLRHLLVYESLSPVAWYKWDNTVILRMDDPGSLEVAYNEIYNTTKLTEEEWLIIGKELSKKNATMSLGYVSGWVDDGNPERGELKISGELISRKKGLIYPSSKVVYQKSNPNFSSLTYDYESEYRGIQRLRHDGLVEVELHGYTHLHPDRQKWADADDRYNNTSWFREFGATAVTFLKDIPLQDHPFYSGINSIKKYFGTTPRVLICPGDEFTNEVLIHVLSSELLMVSSYYLAIKTGEKLCWAQHICAPYLNEANSEWFKSGLPIVGYFHDFDISINGIKWFTENLATWQAAGARQFTDFRTIALALVHTISVHPSDNCYHLVLDEIENLAERLEISIGMFFPGETNDYNINLKISPNGSEVTINGDTGKNIHITLPFNK